MKIKPAPFQSLLDIAIQYTGSADNAFEIAAINNINLSDKVESSELIIPDELFLSTQISKQFSRDINQPATQIDYSDIDGIGVWVIEADFIVS